jgi:hypothetical protein
MLSIIGIKKTIKQHTADIDITHIGLIRVPLYYFFIGTTMYFEMS